jgi:hypothetical protein
MFTPSSVLNEDNGVDELIGQILYFDAPGSYQRIETGLVVARF